jgi:hypothetical protein
MYEYAFRKGLQTVLYGEKKEFVVVIFYLFRKFIGGANKHTKIQ